MSKAINKEMGNQLRARAARLSKEFIKSETERQKKIDDLKSEIKKQREDRAASMLVRCPRELIEACKAAALAREESLNTFCVAAIVAAILREQDGE